MIRGIVADILGNLTDLHLCIGQIRYSVCHSELFHKRGEAAACILTDQRAQVSLAVMEKFCQGSQCQCPVIVLDILEHQGKIGSHLVVLKLNSLAVVADQVREKKMNPADTVIVAEVIILVAFSDRVPDDIFQPDNILRIK